MLEIRDDEDEGGGDQVLVFWEPKEKRERRENINEISERVISHELHMGWVDLGFPFIIIIFLSLG